MDHLAVIGLILLTGIAAYVQTLTGFAFGLITMGGIGLMGILPLPAAAVLVSVLALFNSVLVLARGWRDVAWRQFFYIIGPAMVMLGVGYWVLELLAGINLDWLKLVLGGVIVVSALQLALRPAALPELSSPGSFWFFGVLAGLMGGLFSTPGPPLVYHLYRQPLAHHSVRETLVLVFALSSILRLGLVASSNNLPHGAVWWGLLAIPLIIFATDAAKRWPPPLSLLVIRRAAFILLFLSGLSLGAPAILALIWI